MKDKLRAYPMVILLLPLVAAILLCYYTRWPVNLLHESECETLDSLHCYAFVPEGEPRETSRCERYEARLIARWDTTDHQWLKTEGTVLLYVARDSDSCSTVFLRAGDTLVARTRIHRGGMIGDFNYGMYLRRQGIIGTAYAGKHSAISIQHSAISIQDSEVRDQVSLQKRLYDRLSAAGLTGDELATVGALTLGYKEDLDPELKRRFQASGAAHVLAVSGLHTGILYGILLWLLTLGGRFKPRYENRAGRCAISLIIIGFMWFYAWLTGMTPSVVRAVLMVSLVEVGRMFYRQAFSLNTIACAAVLILLVRPLDLWSVSFQLSFAATVAIVIFARTFEKLFHRIEWRFHWKGKVLSWVLGTVIISVAAQIGTLPITMYTFGQASPYFLLANLIVLPIATFLVPCGLISIVLGGSGAGIVFSKITWALSWAMNHSVGWIESLPGSTIPAHINGGMIVLYYVLLLLFCVIFLKKSQ